MLTIWIRHLALGISLAALTSGCSSWRPPVVIKVVRTINYKLLFWVRNPLEAFGFGSDLRQAIFNAFDENGIGIPFPQRQVYPMEWPPSKEQSLRLGDASHQLQSETEETD